jgi:hypothetical protein
VKKLLIVLFLFTAFLHADFRTVLINEQGELTPSFSEMVDYLLHPKDKSVETIVELTQTMWLQKGKKRWEFDQKEEEKRDLLLPFLRKLKNFERIEPEEKTFDYALVLGALSSRMERRLTFLVELWQKGIKFQQIVFLSSDRPLFPLLETIPEGIHTESELMGFFFKNQPVPDEMRKIPLQVISSPLILNEKGTFDFPNTGHTFSDWLKTKPHPGKCLIISDQPFVGYQDAVARGSLPPTFTCETVGMEALEDLPMAVYLDNLAKWLYQEQKNRSL